MTRYADTPLPLRMKGMPRDKRGFAVPFVVQWDKENQRPYFTVNDSRKSAIAAQKSLCAICGKKLGRVSWYIGGPHSAFHMHGRYFDGPTHLECARYAVVTCPYIAAPNYSKLLADRQVDWDKMEAGVVGVVDPTVMPDRPGLFVLAGSIGRPTITSPQSGVLHYQPRRPWFRYEFWKHGEKASQEEAVALYAGDELTKDWIYLDAV